MLMSMVLNVEKKHIFLMYIIYVHIIYDSCLERYFGHCKKFHLQSIHCAKVYHFGTFSIEVIWWRLICNGIQWCSCVLKNIYKYIQALVCTHTLLNVLTFCSPL